MPHYHLRRLGPRILVHIDRCTTQVRCCMSHCSDIETGRLCTHLHLEMAHDINSTYIILHIYSNINLLINKSTGYYPEVILAMYHVICFKTNKTILY